MQARHDGESACAATIWVMTRLQEIDAHLHQCGVLLSSLRGPLLRAMSLPAFHRVARVSLAGENRYNVDGSPPCTLPPFPDSAEKQIHFNVFDHVACILTARSTIQKHRSLASSRTGMPPNADELVSGVTKRPDRRPVITLAQLKEHRKPDDVWIGSSRPAATSPPALLNGLSLGTPSERTAGSHAHTH